MKIEISPTTIDDIDEYECYRVNMRIKAYTFRVDGKIKAIGGFGYMPSGGAILFLDCEKGTPDKYPVTLVKMLRRVISDAVRLGRRHIFALPDPNNEVIAKRFLVKMGFIEFEEGLLKWQH